MIILAGTICTTVSAVTASVRALAETTNTSALTTIIIEPAIATTARTTTTLYVGIVET